jgi:hypothetical protein
MIDSILTDFFFGRVKNVTFVYRRTTLKVGKVNNVLSFLCLSTASTHPTNQQQNADDYQADDYNDYNDENNDENQTDELSSALPPSVDVTEYKETVHVNDNVILHCDVKNFGGKICRLLMYLLKKNVTE